MKKQNKKQNNNKKQNKKQNNKKQNKIMVVTTTKTNCLELGWLHLL
jgi:hypothetical protein